MPADSQGRPSHDSPLGTPRPRGNGSPPDPAAPAAEVVRLRRILDATYADLQAARAEVAELRRGAASTGDFQQWFSAATQVSLDPFFILAAAPEGAAGTVCDFRVLAANLAAGRFLGRPAEELSGQLISALLPAPGDGTGLLQGLLEAYHTGQPILREFAHTDAGGQPGWLRLQVIRSGDGLALSLVDTTRLHATHDALRLREHAVEEAPVGITIADARQPDLPIVYANRAFTRLTGYPRDEAIGRNCRFLQGKDRDQPGLAAVREALSRGRSCTAVLRNYRKDGTPFWNELSLGPVHDEEGRLTHFVGTLTDITQRREAAQEKERLERKMLEAQKLESLGVLAGGIAHDFNNLLTSILANANVLRLDSGRRSHPAEALEDIELACKQGSALCRQLLAYSGKGRFVIEHLQLANLVDETLQLLRSSLPREIQVEFPRPASLPSIRGDATQLRQVVMNLVLNARDAIQGRRGRIHLELDLHRPAPPSPEPQSDAAQPSTSPAYVRLQVSDDGCGMTAEVRQRLFEPFFTTKDYGHGLGLAAVLGIVRGHQGAISVDSAPGLGTTISVHFPAVEASPAPPPLDDATPCPTQPHVLLADDDPLIRHAAATMLTRLGCTHQAVEDGADALAVFRENPTRFDAALLDLRMPHLDGRDALEGLRSMRPDLPVILMSGYFREEALDQTVPDSRVVFLHKPFDLKLLREKLVQVRLLAPNLPG